MAFALLLGCADLTAPAIDHGPIEAADTTTPMEPTRASPTLRLRKAARLRRAKIPLNEPTPVGQREEKDSEEALPGESERISASYILIAYQGARRAKRSITRGKQEAMARARAARQRALAGEDFANLARELSDGPSGRRGGGLGLFRRKDHGVLSEVAFALKPGEVSDVMEDEFGFSIIKRDD